MEQHCILHDSQPKTRATHLAATSLVHTVEAFEQTWQMLGRNSHAIVTE